MRSQVLVFINVSYFSSAASFHLLASYLMKACHINGSLMAMMHEKSTSLNGALTILEDLLVATLRVVTSFLLIIANSGKSTKR